MIRWTISTRAKLLLGILSVVALVCLYTLVSHLQHVRNPEDTTIPTWGQMAEGLTAIFSAGARRSAAWSCWARRIACGWRV